MTNDQSVSPTMRRLLSWPEITLVCLRYAQTMRDFMQSPDIRSVSTDFHVLRRGFQSPAFPPFHATASNIALPN